MHPSIFRPDTTIKLFCPIFPANRHILHPSIENSNPDTSFCLIFSANGQILHPSIEISNKGTVHYKIFHDSTYNRTNSYNYYLLHKIQKCKGIIFKKTLKSLQKRPNQKLTKSKNLLSLSMITQRLN